MAFYREPALCNNTEMTSLSDNRTPALRKNVELFAITAAHAVRLYKESVVYCDTMYGELVNIWDINKRNRQLSHDIQFYMKQKFQYYMAYDDYCRTCETMIALSWVNLLKLLVVPENWERMSFVYTKCFNPNCKWTLALGTEVYLEEGYMFRCIGAKNINSTSNGKFKRGPPAIFVC